MPIGKWLSVSQSLSGDSTHAIPDMSLTVPAGGRLVKFVAEPFFWSQGYTIGTNPATLGPCLLDTFVELSGGGYTTRNIWMNREAPTVSLAGVFDAVNRANSRVWALVQTAGTREFGTESECSYGGAGHAAMTLRYHVGITTPGGAKAATFYFAARLRALYFA